MKSRLCRALVFASITASWSHGQASLTFEVASVHVASQDPPYRPIPAAGVIKGGPGSEDPERITYTWVLARRLLMEAFGVPLDQISGSDWVMGQDARYDIVATVPIGATKEQVREMLLNLLKERFHLAYHREKKVFDLYTLTIAKGGPKLKDAAEADGPLPSPPQPGTRAVAAPLDRDGFPILPAGRRNAQGQGRGGVSRMTFRMATPEMLLSMLGFSLGGARSEDKTGLMGTYDFHLEVSTASLPGRIGRPPGAPAPGGLGAEDATDPAPDLFTALEKQLGLKLEKGKTELEVTVIDQFDKKPTEN
jgi:uncharacterized protein (TIGR03435 family)